MHAQSADEAVTAFFDLFNRGDLDALMDFYEPQTAPDGWPVRMEGVTSDVLRRQADGSWRFVIDNPWGAAVLG